VGAGAVWAVSDHAVHQPKRRKAMTSFFINDDLPLMLTSSVFAFRIKDLDFIL
jgi:hypothetical protein